MPILATIFPAAAGIGFFLAFVQLLIWKRIRSRPALLFAGLMSVGAGILALCEGAYLQARTVQGFQRLLEFQNLGVAITLVAMVWFVRFRLGSGRVWLAWAITISWTLCAIVSILSEGNLAFSQLESVSLHQTPWGETYGAPIGTIHPFKIVSDITTIAIIIFVVDASIAAYRSGDRSAALVFGGPIVFFIIVAGIHTPLVDAGIVRTPYMISLVFVAIAVSLAIGLVDEAVRGVVLTRELRTERQRWNTLLAGLELAVVHVAPNGRIAYVNPYVERLSGRAQNELLGQDPVVLAPEGESAEIRNILDHKPDWSVRSRVRRSLRTAAGDTRQLLWFSVSLKDQSGEPDGVISIGQDITEQLAAEAEREKTEREIEKLSRALIMGELASTFAHELSQPIAAVLSNAQTLKILQERPQTTDVEIRDIVDDILRDTRRARDLMNRVREFMFNEAPKQTQFELGDMVDEALAMLAAEARMRGVKLRADGPAGDILVEAARLELQQLIINLALNAMQAVGADDGGEVVVGWRATEPETVEIAVEDNGPGLSEDIKKTIFQPFVSSKSTGTGIGLAVVRRVAERHKGRIAVGTSDLGGARFAISVPIALEPMELAVG